MEKNHRDKFNKWLQESEYRAVDGLRPHPSSRGRTLSTPIERGRGPSAADGAWTESVVLLSRVPMLFMCLAVCSEEKYTVASFKTARALKNKLQACGVLSAWRLLLRERRPTVAGHAEARYHPDEHELLGYNSGDQVQWSGCRGSGGRVDGVDQDVRPSLSERKHACMGLGSIPYDVCLAEVPLLPNPAGHQLPSSSKRVLSRVLSLKLSSACVARSLARCSSRRSLQPQHPLQQQRRKGRVLRISYRAGPQEGQIQN